MFKRFLPGVLIDQDDGARHERSKPLQLAQLAAADPCVQFLVTLSVACPFHPEHGVLRQSVRIAANRGDGLGIAFDSTFDRLGRSQPRLHHVGDPDWCMGGSESRRASETRACASATSLFFLAWL